MRRGLKDFSISRVKEKMPWGVSVPGDDTQVMYVWFDALVNYVSAIGWPHDMKTFERYWPVVQYAGKDNVRQQSAMWQAMLMSAGLSPSAGIIINGFVTGAGGLKMSKSIGNVINPFDVVNDYGAEALRYFVINELHPFEDASFTLELFKTAYNAHLANGIGNTASRIIKMAHTYSAWTVPTEPSVFNAVEKERDLFMQSFELHKAFQVILSCFTELDHTIQRDRPFEVYKHNPKEAVVMVSRLVRDLRYLASLLQPFLPATSDTIVHTIDEQKELPALFPRKE